MSLDEAGQLAVERGQDLIEHLDQRHFKPEMDQVLRRLQADEPAADYYRTPRRLRELDPRVGVHPRQEARPPFDPLADRPRVGHGPHMEDPGQIDSGQGRADRRRPGRKHEFVVGLGRDLAGLHVAQVHGLLLRRDGDRLAVRPHVDPEKAAEQLLVRDQEARFLRNHARDMVGKTAVRVRDVRSLFHHEDLDLLIQPAQARRTRRTAGHSAHDDDFHDSSPS